ncbi:MAG: hypothetical protein OXG37_13910 [Actinomycetia bacterium]|nr:hypothetical protein [Actinomycetes bacterium]
MSVTDAEDREWEGLWERTQNHPETAERLCDIARESLAQQRSVGTALDAKLAWVFTGSTLAIGVSAAGLSGGSRPVGIALAVAGAAFIAAAVVVIAGVRARGWKNPTAANYLLADYGGHEKLRLDLAIAHSIGWDYEANEQILNRKARYLSFALAFTGVEVTAVVVAVCLAVFTGTSTPVS